MRDHEEDWLVGSNAGVAGLLECGDTKAWTRSKYQESKQRAHIEDKVHLSVTNGFKGLKT
jgi:hypothetical protein